MEENKLSLCFLNSLIGSQDLRKSVETIWARDKSAFKVMGILIAVRDHANKYVLNANQRCVNMATFFESVDGVMEFLKETGLAELFKQQKVQNLVDYVFGIETGLDSNGRKNRSGHLMEYAVERAFISSGIEFRKEVKSREWTSLQDVLGDDEKRFDFAIKVNGKTYLIEVNFYNSGGSKPNEVARAYTELAPKVNSVEGFEFVWITDGQGWISAKSILKEAYNSIPHVYNLSNLSDFIDDIQLC